MATRLLSSLSKTSFSSLSTRRFSTSPSSFSTEHDAVVVGAGIIGCATALELQKNGLNTLVIDKECGAAQGSTSYSSGIIRTFYSLEETTKLALEGHHYWKDWESYVKSCTDVTSPLAEFTTMPSLLVRDGGCEEWIQTLISNHAALNLPVEEWDMEKLEHELPWISWENFYPPRRIDDEQFGESNPTTPLDGALVLPMSGFVADPQLAANNIRGMAERAGVSFLFNQKVNKIHLNDKRVEGVELEGGELVRGRIIVNAGGPSSNRITEMVYGKGESGGRWGEGKGENDMKVGTRALRVEVAHMETPRGIDFSRENGYIIGDSNLGIYFRPDVGRSMVVGGQEPECDPLHFVEGWEEGEEGVGGLGEEWQHHVYRANLRMPMLGVPSSSKMQGIVSAYDVTEDWCPIYDKSNIPGYFMAIGTSGNQFKNGPVVGKLMAKLIQDVEEGRDHDGSEPCTLPLEKSGMGDLDLRVFSRLRDVNASSGTVMG